MAQMKSRGTSTLSIYLCHCYSSFHVNVVCCLWTPAFKESIFQVLARLLPGHDRHEYHSACQQSLQRHGDTTEALARTHTELGLTKTKQSEPCVSR